MQPITPALKDKDIVPVAKDRVLKPTNLAGMFLRERRFILDLGSLLVKFPLLHKQLRGNGEPVLVVPGFFTSDRSTFLLRAYLSYLGYAVVGWELGMNHGRIPLLLGPLARQVRVQHGKYKMPVRLIGWSLGGYLVREIARDHPQMVHSVITLGSPLFAGPRYKVATEFYQRPGMSPEEIEAEIRTRNQKNITVPLVSIFSKKDRIVNWRDSQDLNTNHNVRHIEVKSSHFGLGFHFEVYKIIAQNLHPSHGTG